MLRLYFVRSDDGDGDNLDLLVVAHSKEEALAFWKQHYELPAHQRAIWVGTVPGVLPQCEPGPIDWDAVRMD